MLNGKKMAILGYHKIGEPSPGGWKSWFYISEETFRSQLQFLHDNGWHVINVSTFLNGLSKPDILQEQSALITFDDGYRSVYEVALPVLRHFGYPAVLFVPTDYIGQYNLFDKGIEPMEAICDWSDLQELKKNNVSIQSHGASHRRFSEIPLADQNKELIESKSILESNLYDRVELIAFPYGDDGKDREITGRYLRETGYRAAFLYGGDPFVMTDLNIYCLPRIAMGPDTRLEDALGTREIKSKR